MSDLAIRVENISKRYRIGSRQPYGDLRDALTKGFYSTFHNVSSLVQRSFNDPVKRHAPADEWIWALKDISFDIKHGEVVGIIGRNGAGKSTLLKILSRITKPTEGYAEIHGRVGSLLEVGTGFHPELTGRENIYLNGTILGMKKIEIQRKFDEIVAFAETEKFIDTPVKHYSSGMYVRLGFAVAAHLEPEIMIVDEVLAVGDIRFQKKCFGKMGDVARAGRTVVLVSHNLAAIEGLCRRALVLDSGEVAFYGSQVEATRFYFNMIRESAPNSLWKSNEKRPDTNVSGLRILEAKITSSGECINGGIPIGSSLEFHVKCICEKKIDQPNLGIGIDNFLAQRVVTLDSEFDPSFEQVQAVEGEFSFVCQVAGLALAPGDYRVKLSLNRGSQPVHVVEDALGFSVFLNDFYNNGGRQGRGFVLCPQNWKLMVK